MELNRALPRPRLADAQIILTVVDNDELLRPVLGVGHPAVLVEGTEVRSNLLLLLKAQVGKVLVAEDEAAPLRTKKGQLVKSGI